jgi:hypothetical protein
MICDVLNSLIHIAIAPEDQKSLLIPVEGDLLEFTYQQFNL